MHQVNRSPHDGIKDHGHPVLEPEHYKNSEYSHDPVIPEHPITGKRLQELKSNKIKGEIWFDKGSSYPTGKYSSKCLDSDQQTKKRTKYYKCRVIDLFKKPPVKHSYLLCIVLKRPGPASWQLLDLLPNRISFRP